MLAPIVLNQLIYYALYVLSYVIDLLIHYDALLLGHILQLLEQLPQVHPAYLSLFLQLPHSERVQMECMGNGCEYTVYD